MCFPINSLSMFGSFTSFCYLCCLLWGLFRSTWLLCCWLLSGGLLCGWLFFSWLFALCTWLGFGGWLFSSWLFGSRLTFCCWLLLLGLLSCGLLSSWLFGSRLLLSFTCGLFCCGLLRCRLLWGFRLSIRLFWLFICLFCWLSWSIWFDHGINNNFGCLIMGIHHLISLSVQYRLGNHWCHELPNKRNNIKHIDLSSIVWIKFTPCSIKIFFHEFAKGSFRHFGPHINYFFTSEWGLPFIHNSIFGELAIRAFCQGRVSAVKDFVD